MSSDALRRELDALSAEYRSRLPAKLAEIHALWFDLASGAIPAARVIDLRRELHSIAGSAKTFGVAAVGEIAAAAESLLDPFWQHGALPEPAGRAELTRLIDALQRAAATV